MKNLPKARTENLLEQEIGKEVMLYDLNIDKAFNLNETLTIVYKACGQNRTFDELKDRHKFTDDFIYLALDELKRENLLAEEYSSPFAGTSRREVIKKVGLATMFALPIITGLIAPKAINAASGADDGRRAGYGEACSTGTCVEGLVALPVQDGWYTYSALKCIGGTCCGVGTSLPIGYTYTESQGMAFGTLDEPPTGYTSNYLNYDCCGNVSTNTEVFTLLEKADPECEEDCVYFYDYSITKTCR